MTDTKHRRLIILGSGPAGFTAAVYAARANLAPTVITGVDQGGQLVKTAMIDNWPGDVNGVVGYDLMQRLQRHAERFATEIISDHIVEVDCNRKPFHLMGERVVYTCDALIIATGTTTKYLGISGEQKFLGRGVSTCAMCDGYFYKKAKVAIVGGGNTAINDALFLAEFAKEVMIVHRRDTFTADYALVEKIRSLVASGKVRVLWQHIVEEILGDEEGVTAIRVKNLTDNQRSDEAVKGVFIAIGLVPNSELFSKQLVLHSGGYIKTTNDDAENFTATSIAGVFAAGDVASRAYHQAITASATGCMAALDAKKYLAVEN